MLATPFDDTGAADAHALTRIVEFSERDHLLDAVAGAVRGRVPLIVGASAADPRNTILYLYKASTLGAAAAMVMAPAASGTR